MRRRRGQSALAFRKTAQTHRGSLVNFTQPQDAQDFRSPDQDPHNWTHKELRQFKKQVAKQLESSFGDYRKTKDQLEKEQASYLEVLTELQQNENNFQIALMQKSKVQRERNLLRKVDTEVSSSSSSDDELQKLSKVPLSFQLASTSSPKGDPKFPYQPDESATKDSEATQKFDFQLANGDAAAKSALGALQAGNEDADSVDQDGSSVPRNGSDKQAHDRQAVGSLQSGMKQHGTSDKGASSEEAETSKLALRPSSGAAGAAELLLL